MSLGSSRAPGSEFHEMLHRTAFNLPNVSPRARLTLACVTAMLLAIPAVVLGQMTAQARTAPTPPWTRGIVPINQESYYNAIECGKQGGADPPCVFWDTGLCKNPDFVLTFYTPYKAVAYEVWQAVSRKQPPPQPDYAAARRTR